MPELQLKRAESFFTRFVDELFFRVFVFPLTLEIGLEVLLDLFAPIIGEHSAVVNHILKTAG